MEAIKRAQESDPDMAPLYSALRDNEKPLWDAILDASQETKAYWTQWDRLTLRHGIMYRRYSSAQMSVTLQLLVPLVYRPEVVRQAQKGFTRGRMGERRTLEQVRRRAYWHGWASETRRFCRRGSECYGRRRTTAVERK